MNQYIITGTLAFMLAGCSSNVDYNDPDELAAAISEGCEGHAEVAEKKGRRYFASYTDCMNRTLYHLKTRAE